MTVQGAWMKQNLSLSDSRHGEDVLIVHGTTANEQSFACARCVQCGYVKRNIVTTPMTLFPSDQRVNRHVQMSTGQWRKEPVG